MTDRTELLRDRLQDWYRARLGLGARVTEFQPTQNGAINETILHSVTCELGGTPVVLPNVLRLEPSCEVPIPGVDLVEQCKTLRALAMEQAIPAPRVLWEERDPQWLGQPFFVMERLAGEPVFDVEDLTPPEDTIAPLFRQALAMLARIHEIDWQLPRFSHLASKVDPADALGSNLATYRIFLTKSSGGNRYDLLEQAYDWLVANRPRALPPVFNWGDCRVGNLLYRDGQLSGVLDWEMAEIAPREADVGWCIFLERFYWGSDASVRKGGLTADEIARSYQDSAGVALIDLPYFEIWAGFRLAVMRMRAGRQMMATGEIAPETRLDEVNPVTDHLADLLGQPRPR